VSPLYLVKLQRKTVCRWYVALEVVLVDAAQGRYNAVSAEQNNGNSYMGARK